MSKQQFWVLEARKDGLPVTRHVMPMREEACACLQQELARFGETFRRWAGAGFAVSLTLTDSPYAGTRSWDSAEGRAMMARFQF